MVRVNVQETGTGCDGNRFYYLFSHLFIKPKTIKPTQIKRRAVFTLVFILFSHLLLAQARTDTIGCVAMRHFAWRGSRHVAWRTYKGEKIKSAHKLSTILRDDPEAFKINKKAMRCLTRGLTLDGAVIATCIGNRASNNPHANPDHNVPYIAAECGFLAGAYICLFSAIRNQKKAVKKINADVLKASYNEVRPKFYFSYTGFGVGVGLRF